MPQRIQRKRTRGWKMPANTVSVTRPGKLGNNYHLRQFCKKGGCGACCDTREEAVERFRQDKLGEAEFDGAFIFGEDYKLTYPQDIQNLTFRTLTREDKKLSDPCQTVLA